MSFKIPKTTLKTTFPFTTHIYSPPGTSLDLYLPVSPSPPHKTLIYFHGGGLATGTRDAFLPDPICTSLLSSSWAVISADYSLLPQATAADILSDLLALEAWILAHPDINTEHIALGGSSAGGYVASLAAGNWTQVKPRALLDLFGVVDVTGEHWAQRKEVAPVVFKSPTADLEEAGFAELLGSKEILSCHELTLDQPPKKGGRASWVLWCIKEGIFLDFLLGRHPSQQGRNTVKKGEEGKYLPVQLAEKGGFPPTLVVHGDADDVVPIRDSEVLVEVLRRKGVEVEFRVVEGGGHGLFPLDQQEVVYAAATEFMVKAVG